MHLVWNEDEAEDEKADRSSSEVELEFGELL